MKILVQGTQFSGWRWTQRTGRAAEAWDLLGEWGWFWDSWKDLSASHFNHLPIYLFLLYGSWNKPLVYFWLNDAMETGPVAGKQRAKQSVLARRASWRLLRGTAASAGGPQLVWGRGWLCCCVGYRGRCQVWALEIGNKGRQLLTFHLGRLLQQTFTEQYIQLSYV